MRKVIGKLLFGAFATLFISALGVLNEARGATNTFNFSYANRTTLLNSGWSFVARTAIGGARDTEITDTNLGAVVSYDQGIHPGVLRIPVDVGDVWQSINDSRNTLFQNLAPNWVSMRLKTAFKPVQDTQQLLLLAYQDDDNYVAVGHVYNGSEKVTLVNELGRNPQVVGIASINATNLYLRLDRDLNTGNVSGYYSLNGTNWVSLGQTWQTLINPKVAIFSGGSSGGFPNADLEQLEIITQDNPPLAQFILQPRHLVFNAVAGQPLTNLQDVHVIVRGQDAPVPWLVTSNASWLQFSEATGNTPGTCQISANPTGLAAGVYEAALAFSGVGAVATQANVTLIVNPAVRAGVATWKGGKAGAMTVSTDDSYSSGYAELLTNSLRGTFLLWNVHPIPSLFTAAYLDGMELGAHTFNHYCYEVNEAAFRYQLENNIASIVAATSVSETAINSFAFPCGFNTIIEQVVAADYFLATRGYNINQLEDASPANFALLKSFNSHNYPPNPPGDLKTLVDAAMAQGKWFNLVLHELTNDDGAISYSVGKDIWVDTLGAVTKYMQQRDRTVITNYSETPNLIQFDCYRLALGVTSKRNFETALTTNDTVTFQVGLTNLAVISVAVGGNARPFAIRSSGGMTNLYFDALVSTSAQPVVVSLSSLPILTVTPDNKTRVYLQPDPVLTGTVTGVQGGDNITATYTTTATTNSSVGTYPITPVLADPNGKLGNYYVITNTGTLTITKSGATVTLTGLTQTYDGTARMVSASTTPSGLTVVLSYAGSVTAPTNAGSYEVIGTISELNHVGSATNTLVIATHALSVVADSASRLYGQANPVFTGSLTGVQPGDNISAGYSTIATESSPIGTYDIVPLLVDPNGRLGNYAVTATNGVLTVAGAPRFSSITRTPAGTVKLVCEVYVGRRYAFQYKNDLADTEWTTFVTDYTAVSSSVEILDNAGINSRRFYRAVDVTDP